MFVILQWRPCYTITLGSRRGLGGMVFGPLGSVLSDSSYWLSSVYFPFENFWILLHRDDLHTPSSPYFPVLAQYGEEGPPPMLQERFFTVISQLFEHVRNQFFFFSFFRWTVEIWWYLFVWPWCLIEPKEDNTLWRRSCRRHGKYDSRSASLSWRCRS